MTAPVWMASPPEVHSALLSAGPGPGSLVAAAQAWTALSAEYTSVAEELGAVVAGVQAGAWEGPSAESFVAAFVPYLAWLVQASTKSATAAASHETAAVAYTAALTAMPTLAELAANHVIHGVLLATNFFGINTIPIALNEADYVRMWIQAAATMATYQAVSSAAVASAPQTPPAPQIVKAKAAQDPDSDAGYSDAGVGYPVSKAVNQFVTEIFHALDNQIADVNLGEGTVNGIVFDAYANPSQPIYYLVRVLDASADVFHGNFTNPTVLFGNIISALDDVEFHTLQTLTYFAPQLEAAALDVATVAPAGSVGGFAGLAGLAGIQPVSAVAPAPVAPSPVIAPVATTPTVVASAVAPATAPAPAPAPATAPAAAAPPPPAPPAAGGLGFVPPYAVGPPGIGVGSGMSTSASSSAKKKAPEPDSAAAAAAATAAAREQRQTRRRKRAGLRGYGDEFMDMNVEVDPDWGTPPTSTAASDQSAGALGFAGTVLKGTAPAAAGLTRLAGDEFGGGPTMPMVPGTWNGDHAGEAEEGGEHD
jgi:PPE-repeat protein